MPICAFSSRAVGRLCAVDGWANCDFRKTRGQPSVAAGVPEGAADLAGLPQTQTSPALGQRISCGRRNIRASARGAFSRSMSLTYGRAAFPASSGAPHKRAQACAINSTIAINGAPERIRTSDPQIRNLGRFEQVGRKLSNAVVSRWSAIPLSKSPEQIK